MYFFFRWRQLVVPFENKNKKIKRKDVFSATALATCTSASGPASWHHASLDATQQIKTTTTKIISSGNTTGRLWGRGPRISSSEVSRQSLVVWWSLLHCSNSALGWRRLECLYIYTNIYIISPQGTEIRQSSCFLRPDALTASHWGWRWTRSSCCGSARTAAGSGAWAAGWPPAWGAPCGASAKPWWWSRR